MIRPIDSLPDDVLIRCILCRLEPKDIGSMSCVARKYNREVIWNTLFIIKFGELEQQFQADITQHSIKYKFLFRDTINMNRQMSCIKPLLHDTIDNLVAKYPFATEIKINKRQWACHGFLAHFSPLKYVRYLKIKTPARRVMMQNLDFINFISTHSHLCRLVLEGCTSVSEDRLIQAIATCKNKLTVLRLKECQVTNKTVTEIAKCQPNLRRLTISGIDLSDRSFDQIAVNLLFLERLSLKTTATFSFTAAISLATKNNALKRVRIGPCDRKDKKAVKRAQTSTKKVITIWTSKTPRPVG